MMYALTPTLAYGDPEGAWDTLVTTIDEALVRIMSLEKTVVPTKDMAIEILEALGVDPERAMWLATPQRIDAVLIDGWEVNGT